MNRKLKIVLLASLGIFLTMQFLPVTREKFQPAEKEKSFEHQLQVPSTALSLLKRACYDCHSDEMRNPWYTSLAPVSWMIGNHIKEGRKNLNFSRWADYSSGIQGKKLDEITEQLRQGTMPPWNYVLLHPGARLSTDQTKMLIKYLENQEN